MFDLIFAAIANAAPLLAAAAAAAEAAEAGTLTAEAGR